MGRFPILAFIAFTATIAFLDVSCNAVNAEDARNAATGQTKKSLGLPILKFLVCTSWGYNSATVEFADIISQKFPAIKIEESTYPPACYLQCIASLISFIKFSSIILILTKVDPFRPLGFNTPKLYRWAIENMIYSCLMTYFICNAIETQLLSTGAFEIMMDDCTLWSKLESGRIPKVEELLKIIENHMENKQG